MNRSSRIAWTLRTGMLLTVCVWAVAGGQPVEDQRFAPRIQAARDTLLRALETYGTPGASVSVIVDGSLVWSEAFGYASVELRAPVTRRTKFRIGSVSKALTAGAVALLVQEGRLDLDSPVQRYVPGFPEKRYPVSTRQVAGHIAGIRHYRGQEMMSQKRYNTVDEGLSIFRDDTLMFKPGSRYGYSSYGFNLVSAVVEGASGMPFLRFMSARIFQPLGMTSTVAEYPDSIIPDRSAFYASGPVHTNAPMVDNSYKWAGGGFISTTDDLVRYADEVMAGPMFTPQARELMFTSQRLDDGTETSYSIGWTIGRIGEVLSVSHAGGSIGGTAMLILVPEKRVAIAVLCNDDSRFTRSAYGALKVFLGD